MWSVSSNTRAQGRAGSRVASEVCTDRDHNKTMDAVHGDSTVVRKQSMMWHDVMTEMRHDAQSVTTATRLSASRIVHNDIL